MLFAVKQAVSLHEWHNGIFHNSFQYLTYDFVETDKSVIWYKFFRPCLVIWSDDWILLTLRQLKSTRRHLEYRSQQSSNIKCDLSPDLGYNWLDPVDFSVSKMFFAFAMSSLLKITASSIGSGPSSLSRKGSWWNTDIKQSTLHSALSWSFSVICGDYFLCLNQESMVSFLLQNWWEQPLWTCPNTF